MPRYPLEGVAREINEEHGLSMNEFVIRWVIKNYPGVWVNGSYLRNPIRDATGYELKPGQIGQALHATRASSKWNFDGHWVVELGTPSMYKWQPGKPAGQATSYRKAEVALVRAPVEPPVPTPPTRQPVVRNLRVVDTRADGSKLLVIDDDYYLAKIIET